MPLAGGSPQARTAQAPNHSIALRWHNRQGRRNALRRLGVSGRALGVAGCRHGQSSPEDGNLEPLWIHLTVGGRSLTTGLNRRMQKTACPVVWED